MSPTTLPAGDEQAQAAEYDARGIRLFESGRIDEAMASFREAICLDGHLATAHYNLGNALVASRRTEEACAAYRSALGQAPDLALAHGNLGLALLELGDLDGAQQALARAVELAPERPEAASGLAIALVRRGDLRSALDVLERNLARAPNNTRDLSLEAVVLERLGEPSRARGLLDFDRLVVTSKPPAPPGFENVAAFNAALARYVLAHPSLADSPARHATRGGRHSGELLQDATPVTAALQSMIESEVERYASRAVDADAHPFFTGAPESVTLTAWAIVLERGGYQIPHIHPAGWLSGVYYVRVPTPRPDRPDEGGIEFGRPDPALAGDDEPKTRLLRPAAGSMVLFPSYIYHRTVPFDAVTPRISIAFDCEAASGDPSAAPNGERPCAVEFRCPFAR